MVRNWGQVKRTNERIGGLLSPSRKQAGLVNSRTRHPPSLTLHSNFEPIRGNCEEGSYRSARRTGQNLTHKIRLVLHKDLFHGPVKSKSKGGVRGFSVARCGDIVERRASATRGVSLSAGLSHTPQHTTPDHHATVLQLPLSLSPSCSFHFPSSPKHGRDDTREPQARISS